MKLDAAACQPLMRARFGLQLSSEWLLAALAFARIHCALPETASAAQHEKALFEQLLCSDLCACTMVEGGLLTAALVDAADQVLIALMFCQRKFALPKMHHFLLFK